MADGEHSEAAMARLARLADPLFPLTSRAVRRCVAAAESLGLVCIPQPINVPLQPPYGVNTKIVTWEVPKSAGPLCIVHMDLPEDHPTARIIPRVGEEQFVDGSVIQSDAFEYPRRYNGTLMESPIPVRAQYTVNVEMTDTTATYDLGQGLTFYTLGVRARLKRISSLCEAPTDLATAWLEMVRQDGVWWGTTVRSSPTSAGGTTQGPISSAVVVETLVLAEKRATIEGEGNAQDAQLRVVPTIVTPFNGPLFGRRFDGDRALVQPGLRWPIPGGSTVEVQTTYGAGVATRVPVRATLLGRRGGIVSGCLAPGPGFVVIE